ncbi:MAG: glycosyltransferase, partial [Nocardioidaceae bacterium]
MDAPSKLRSTLGGALRRGRRVGSKLRSRPSEQATTRPKVSVIVPIYNVEKYVDECLTSIREQHYRNLEILVVDDGSPDGSAAIAARHAKEDTRIEVIRQKNAGLGAARNTGVRHATGDYLAFVDSDDVIPRKGISRLVTSGERSGSDIVVGALTRFNSTEHFRPEWTSELHGVDRLGIATADFPEIIRNNYSCGKLFRTAFWRSCGLWFREGVSYEDQPLVTQLYCRASGIDIVSASTYEWRQRDDFSSISQQTHTLRDLKDRIAAWDLSHDTLTTEASAVIYDTWLKTLYATHFHWYFKSASTVDDEYWAGLQQAVERLTADAPADIAADLEPSKRIAVELVRRNLREKFHEFKALGGYSLNRFPAELKPGGLEFKLPTFGDPAVAIPDGMYCLPDHHVPLIHRLDRASWTKGGDLRVEGWAYFRYVDLTGQAPCASFILRHERTGEKIEVDAVETPDRGFFPPQLDGAAFMHDKWASYDKGCFAAVMPVADLVDRCDPRTG